MKRQLRNLNTGEVQEYEIAVLPYITKSICECGHPVMRDEIELGREYEVIIDRRKATFTCGGCNKTFEVETVLARQNNGVWRGLPVGIFEKKVA